MFNVGGRGGLVFSKGIEKKKMRNLNNHYSQSKNRLSHTKQRQMKSLLEVICRVVSSYLGHVDSRGFEDVKYWESSKWLNSCAYGYVIVILIWTCCSACGSYLWNYKYIWNCLRNGIVDCSNGNVKENGTIQSNMM